MCIVLLNSSFPSSLSYPSNPWGRGNRAHASDHLHSKTLSWAHGSLGTSDSRGIWVGLDSHSPSPAQCAPRQTPILASETQACTSQEVADFSSLRGLGLQTLGLWPLSRIKVPEHPSQC